MSNVEQGIMNVEVRMFLLDCFGANNAHKWNLNRFSFLHYSTFPVRHSTFNQYVQWLNCIIFMVSLFCIAPLFDNGLKLKFFCAFVNYYLYFTYFSCIAPQHHTMPVLSVQVNIPWQRSSAHQIHYLRKGLFFEAV